MKKILTLTIVLLTLANFTYKVTAQSEEATSPAKASSSAVIEVDETIKAFKERVAKVAESGRSEQQALSGRVVSQKDNKLTVLNNNNETYSVTVEKDLTMIYSLVNGVKKEKELGDIAKDDYIIVTGPAMDKIINANSIYIEEQYLLQSGKVTEINKEDFYLNILNTDKENNLIDIETYSKIFLINIKTLESERIGFSKLKVGDTVHVVYIKSVAADKKEKRYSATRILVIPQEYFLQ